MRDDSTPRSDEQASSPSSGSPGRIASVRQLPTRPSLEHEREEAKKLYYALRQHDAEAIHRAESFGVTIGPTREIELSDAQLVIAREYGFRSWSRLVEYFTTLERHVRATPRPFSDRSSYEHAASSVVDGHRAHNPGIAQFLGTFVPRLYGATTEEILASDVTIADARLVAPRQYLCPSWDALLAQPVTPGWTGLDSFEAPVSLARYAIRNGDLSKLAAIADAHPELLHTSGSVWDPGYNLMANAVSAEVENPSATAVAITDWLVARGLDATRAWSRYLIGEPFRRMTVGHVEYALRRGADPNWLPPNGISILEHAIYRYWNGEAVDRVAARVTAPDAFWVAAGLGDVKGVRRFLDPTGKPTPAARHHRPDFTAMSVSAGMLLSSSPGASDEHILWEACLIAGYNSRFEVIDLLIDAGFPIDYAESGISILQFAVQWQMVELVEHLVARGANPELRMAGGYSARSGAETGLRYGVTVNRDLMRILRICGGDPDAVMRARARETGPAVVSPGVQQTVHRARRDAARRGHRSVQREDLLVTLLRDMPPHLFHYFAEAGGDVTRVRQAIGERATADGDEPTTSEVPMSDEATTVLAAAQALAERHHREQVRPEHLAWALAEDETGPFATVLGASPETIRKFRARLDRG